MLPSSRYIRCAGYEIHCTEWGAPEAPVVIAWHGLARTGRNMDELVRIKSRDYTLPGNIKVYEFVFSFSYRDESALLDSRHRP